MSVDRQRDVEVDIALDENAAQVTVTERREVAELFDDNDELRLWEDDDGWTGYLLDESDYYWINTKHDPDDWARKQPVTETTVQDHVERHIRDPEAGGVGVFRRRCSPP